MITYILIKTGNSPNLAKVIADIKQATFPWYADIDADIEVAEALAQWVATDALPPRFAEEAFYAKNEDQSGNPLHLVFDCEGQGDVPSFPFGGEELLKIVPTYLSDLGVEISASSKRGGPKHYK